MGFPDIDPLLSITNTNSALQFIIHISSDSLCNTGLNYMWKAYGVLLFSYHSLTISLGLLVLSVKNLNINVSIRFCLTLVLNSKHTVFY